MQFARKYIQFNDLVIDNYDMLQNADLSGGFKTETQEYSFGHGSYAPFSPYQYSREQTVSMSLKFNTKKLSCEQREYYKDFVTLNLSKPGMLWAIQGNQLIWTIAFVSDFGEAYTGIELNTFNIDVDFVLPEGVWHKADPRKTFLKPYDPCNVLECEDFHKADICNDCCTACISTATEECPTCLCECDFLSSEYSLCEMQGNLQEFYQMCGGGYKIIYNCLAGIKLWGAESMLGQKICKAESCSNVVAGQFYSDTILETENVTITIIGTAHNPLITINGNSLQVIGEYDGILTITPNGEAYFQADECCESQLIDINNLIIPDNSTFGFRIHHGNNSLIVDTQECCNMACVYIKVDSITT